MQREVVELRVQQGGQPTTGTTASLLGGLPAHEERERTIISLRELVARLEAANSEAVRQLTSEKEVSSWLRDLIAKVDFNRTIFLTMTVSYLD
jgi:hypothetical protein